MARALKCCVRASWNSRKATRTSPPAVYVNVRDNTNKLPGLRARPNHGCNARAHTIVPNPSEAGYILQVVVLAAGVAAPESVRQMVAAGYVPLKLGGRGGTALVADVLLVQRNVPSAKQPARSKLKSISKRNAVASSQMRIGLLALQEFKVDTGVPPIFAETMGKELATHIHGASGQEARSSLPAPVILHCSKGPQLWACPRQGPSVTGRPFLFPQVSAFRRPFDDRGITRRIPAHIRHWHCTCFSSVRQRQPPQEEFM